MTANLAPPLWQHQEQTLALLRQEQRVLDASDLDTSHTLRSGSAAYKTTADRLPLLRNSRKTTNPIWVIVEQKSAITDLG